MNRSVMLLCLMAVCLLSACTKQNYYAPSSSNSTTSTSSETSASNAPSEPSEPTNSEQLETESFINLDQFEQYGIVTGSSMVYSEDDMNNMSKDDAQKDYVTVVKNYVQQELSEEVSYLDSVDGTYNPRHVVVGTTEGNTYMFVLRKWYNYNGIWTVSRYAQFKEEGAVSPKQAVEYELTKPSNLPASVQKEVNVRIDSKKEERSYIDDNGTIYVLLVAPQGQSVELLNVFGTDYLIEVQYTTMETPTQMFGENPYVLIKVNQSITDISFKKYSSVIDELVRLNMP
ncbi:MAG: hypothetical protein ACQEXQ_28680 [Bacillota bacterium]